VMPSIFALLHFPYGIGSVWAAAKLAREPKFWQKLRRMRQQRRAAAATPAPVAVGS
jgi:hypothetical protein